MNSAKFPDCAGILFDFGGTLDSDGEHWLDRFFALFKEAGYSLPPEDIKGAFYQADASCEADARVDSWGLRRLMYHHVGLQFAALGLDDFVKRDEMAEAFCRKSENYLRRNAPLLHKAAKRFRLGLVSNFYGNVATICAEEGLASSLDVIVDSGRCGQRKPETGIFLAALRGLGLVPEQVVFVGDSYERDMIPARRLGMRTIWLKGPNPRIPVDAEPVDAWIFSLTELERLIL